MRFMIYDSYNLEKKILFEEKIMPRLVLNSICYLDSKRRQGSYIRDFGEINSFWRK